MTCPYDEKANCKPAPANVCLVCLVYQEAINNSMDTLCQSTEAVIQAAQQLREAIR